MQKNGLAASKRKLDEQNAQILDEKFGRATFERSRKRVKIEKERKINGFARLFPRRTLENQSGHMIFDIAPIPDRYYLIYEKCVNMEPEIETRQRAEWGLLRESKGGFWYD